MKVVAVKKDTKSRIIGVKLDDGTEFLGDEMLNCHAENLMFINREDSENGFYVKTMPNESERDNLDSMPEF